MGKAASDIPVGTQFTPALINLEPFLAALCKYGGDRGALHAAIWSPAVHRKQPSIPKSRRRANLPLEAGGAEIDVTLGGLMGVIPTVWQVQCKNTPSGRIRLEDVSKEVGQVPTTRATHVMLVANATITRDAVEFSMATMRNSPLTIFLLGAQEYEAIKKNPGALGAILRAQAEKIVRNRTKLSPKAARETS